MVRLFDDVDLHVVLVTLISVPAVISVRGGMAVVFLVGLAPVPKP
ncbi:MAG: hypothetical protein OET44_17290 [Gammaproteobacteria bacterium]|nr:hypothetical protein [Gammaproteobacteria bacterium]